MAPYISCRTFDVILTHSSTSPRRTQRDFSTRSSTLLNRGAGRGGGREGERRHAPSPPYLWITCTRRHKSVSVYRHALVRPEFDVPVKSKRGFHPPVSQALSAVLPPICIHLYVYTHIYTYYIYLCVQHTDTRMYIWRKFWLDVELMIRKSIQGRPPESIKTPWGMPSKDRGR